MSTPSAARTTVSQPVGPLDPADRLEGEQVVLAVGSPAHGGHCVARPADDPDGHVVFVRHALPGETVRAVMTQKTSKVWRAEAVEVLSASPDRVAALWPQAGPGGVGGGELSHVALPAQRTWKRWVLADCLRRIGGPVVADAVAALGQGAAPRVEPLPDQAETARTGRHADGTGSRTRVSLVADAEGQLGMHAFRSARVVDPGDLVLAVDTIRELGLTGGSARKMWRRLTTPGATVRAVAPSDGEPVVVISSPTAHGRGGARGTDGRRVVLSAAGRPVQRRRVHEVVDCRGLGLGELRYAVDVEGFWQVHPQAPTVLTDAVVRGALTGRLRGQDHGGGVAGAGEGVSVLELYSGAGLFTLALARAQARVSSVEGSVQALRDARRNLHGQDRVTLHQGRVDASVVDQVGAGSDVVVLDPPRAGAGRQVMEAVCASTASRVVMVSCDPASASRDLAALLRGGFRLTGMRALDMFPHTHHFETLTLLER